MRQAAEGTLHALGLEGRGVESLQRQGVRVEFANAPRGLRVTETRADGPELDLSLGYSMLGGS